MNTLVGITAVKDHRHDLLDQVVSDLNLAGWRCPYISYDDQTRGPYGNFQYCLATMLNSSPAVDWLLVVQDDVRIASHLRDWLDTQEAFLSKRSVYSLYTAAPHHKEEVGWHNLYPLAGRFSYGACAIMLSSDAARWFLIDPPNRGCLTRTCFWLAEWCRKTNRDYVMHSPSLVCHVGVKSIVNPAFDTAIACQPYRNARVWCPDAKDMQTVVDLLTPPVPAVQSAATAAT